MRRPQITTIGVVKVAATLALLLAIVAILMRDRVNEVLNPVRAGGVRVDITNDRLSALDNGDQTFQTEMSLASEEPFQMRISWQALPKPEIDQLLPLVAAPQNSKVVTTSQPETGQESVPATDQTPSERRLITTIDPVAQFVGHKYVHSVRVAALNGEIHIDAGETHIASPLEFPSRPSSEWKLVNVWGAGPTASSCLSQNVPKTYALSLFERVDPSSRIHEYCAFQLWIEFANADMAR